MNTKSQRAAGAIIAAVLLLAASHCAVAQTATPTTSQASTLPPVQNCTVDGGLVERVRTCQTLHPLTLELLHTQACTYRRTIWSDKPELVGCTINKPAAAAPAPAPAPAPVADVTTAPARPCQ